LNPKQEYTNGNKEMEMRSYVEALKIIEETGIERGR
jgi:ribonuclease HI